MKDKNIIRMLDDNDVDTICDILQEEVQFYDKKGSQANNTILKEIAAVLSKITKDNIDIRVNAIIVELSEEDRLAGHIPDEYYRLARVHNVFYEDKKLGKLVQVLDLTEGDEEAVSISCLETIEEGCTPIDAIDLRQANLNLMKENYELLKALREAVEIIEDEYGTEDEVMGPVLIKYRALIYRLEGFKAMIDRLEED